MSGNRSSGLEPFSSWDLIKFYEEDLDATFVSQVGSHRWFTTSNGIRVGAAVGCGNRVTTAHLRQTARTLSMSYSDLRARLGHPIIKSSKPKKGMKRNSPRQAAGKAQVIATAEAVSSDARSIAGALRSGSRDQSVYDTAIDNLKQSQAMLHRALPEAFS